MLSNLVFVFACCVVLSSANIETSKRVIEELNCIINDASAISVQVQAMFAHNLLSSDDTSRITRALHSLLTPNPRASYVRVLVGDVFVAFSQEHHTSMTTQANGLSIGAANAGCVCNAPVCTPLCVNVFSTALETGQPVAFNRSFAVDASQVFVADITAHQLVFQTFTSSLPPTVPSTSSVVELVTSLHSTNGTMIGRVGVGISVQSLSRSILHSILGVTSAEAVDVSHSKATVAVVDDATGLVVAAASTATDTTDGLCTLWNATSELWLAQSSDRCSDPFIGLFGSMLRSAEKLQTPRLFVDEDSQRYAISLPFARENASWHVLMIGKISVQPDMLAPGSSIAISLQVVSAFMCIISIAILVWVLRFREMQLWSVAQPWLLVTLQIGCIICKSLVFVFVGPPTPSICLARQWMLLCGGTFLISAMTAKLMRVYVNLTYPQDEMRKRLAFYLAFVLIGVAVFFEAIMLMIWQLQDPSRPMLEYRSSFLTSSVVGHEVCTSTSSFWYVATRFFLLIIFAFCCALSFKTRKFSPLFAESRALMTISVHGLCLTTILVLATAVVGVTYRASILQVLCALLWITTTPEMALYYPRFLRQVTTGELTTLEIKEMVIHHLKIHNKKPQDESLALFGDNHHHHHTPRSEHRSQPRLLFASAPASERELVGPALCVI